MHFFASIINYSIYTSFMHEVDLIVIGSYLFIWLSSLIVLTDLVNMVLLVYIVHLHNLE